MATLFGKLIGYAFVLGVLLSPLFGSIYFGKDLYYAFNDSTAKQATIIDCYTISTKSGGNVKYSHAPIAKTAAGETVKGSFGFKDVNTCKEKIGNTVGVYISNISKNKSQINTFFQLWFMPLMFFAISLILYIAMFKGYKKKLKSRSNS